MERTSWGTAKEAKEFLLDSMGLLLWCSEPVHMSG